MWNASHLKGFTAARCKVHQSPSSAASFFSSKRCIDCDTSHIWYCQSNLITKCRKHHEGVAYCSSLYHQLQRWSWKQCSGTGATLGKAQQKHWQCQCHTSLRIRKIAFCFWNMFGGGGCVCSFWSWDNFYKMSWQSLTIQIVFCLSKRKKTASTLQV